VHWLVAAHRLDLEAPLHHTGLLHDAWDDGSEIERIYTLMSSVACVRFYMLRTVGQLHTYIHIYIYTYIYIYIYICLFVQRMCGRPLFDLIG
jgi:hypothetical protein